MEGAQRSLPAAVTPRAGDRDRANAAGCAGLQRELAARVRALPESNLTLLSAVGGDRVRDRASLLQLIDWPRLIVTSTGL